jgi:hypothetical protein
MVMTILYGALDVRPNYPSFDKTTMPQHSSNTSICVRAWVRACKREREDEDEFIASVFKLVEQKKNTQQSEYRGHVFPSHRPFGAIKVIMTKLITIARVPNNVTCHPPIMRGRINY